MSEYLERRRYEPTMPVVMRYPCPVTWRGTWKFTCKVPADVTDLMVMAQVRVRNAHGDIVIPNLIVIAKDSVMVWLNGIGYYEVSVIL